MSGTQNAAGSVARSNASPPKVEGTVLSEAQIGAMLSEAEANGRKAGLAEGRAAERERMGAILGSDEAKGREGLARHFAFESDVTAEAAKAALTAGPKTDPTKSPDPNRFDAAMEAAGNPRVGLEPGQAADDGVAYVDAYLSAKRQKRSA